MGGDYKFNTLGLHAGHSPDAQFGSRTVPIHQTTSYMFQDTEQAASSGMAALFLTVLALCSAGGGQ